MLAAFLLPLFLRGRGNKSYAQEDEGTCSITRPLGPQRRGGGGGEKAKSVADRARRNYRRGACGVVARPHRHLLARPVLRPRRGKACASRHVHLPQGGSRPVKSEVHRSKSRLNQVESPARRPGAA